MKQIIVFYARDFLAERFALIGKSIKEADGVFICTSNKERRKILSIYQNATIFKLQEDTNRSEEEIVSLIEKYKININNDRFIRKYSNERIARIVGGILDVALEIAEKHKPTIYLDEPVSNIQNQIFNRVFTFCGTKCLHFHAAWVPGYMFFTEDFAQQKPVKLNMVDSSLMIVSEHWKNRKKSTATPVYLKKPKSKFTAAFSALLTFAKGVLRSYFRKKDYYLNSDPSAHFIHAQALLKSIFTRYDDIQLLNTRNKKFVFYPMHYEPEAVINYYGPFTRQLEIVERILDSLPLGYELILKEHPSQPGALGRSLWKDVIKSKRVKVISGNFDASKLLRMKNLNISVVSIGSTMALEAALYGRKVNLLGHPHFAKMPSIQHISEVENWSTTDDIENQEDKILIAYSEFFDDYAFKCYFLKSRPDLFDLDVVTSTISRILENIQSCRYS